MLLVSLAVSWQDTIWRKALHLNGKGVLVCLQIGGVVAAKHGAHAGAIAGAVVNIASSIVCSAIANSAARRIIG